MAERYDVVIVGGGIHGVGVAQAAAAAGHSVLVIEERGLAAGTSSRSSKLIHGGLRYLEQGRLGVVRECLRERAILLRVAPGLVHRRHFLIPVFAATRRRPWKIAAGLGLYSILAGLASDARFRRVGRDEWGALDGLSTEGLQTVFEYTDAQTDDAALTAAVMRSAQGLGAELALPAAFIGARLASDGCEIDYRPSGASQKTCRAAVLVNAAGPWAPRVQRAVAGAPAPRPVELVQGAHLLLRGKLDRGAYYVESPADGRAVFVMPFGDDRTLVGTTETPFRGDPGDVRPTDQERAYLSEVVDRYFPRYRAGEGSSVVSSFAGVRVLPAGSGRASARSRETILDVDDGARPRLLTILGGKLTAYRATAEKVMARLQPALPSRRRVADTATLHLEPEE